MGGELIIVFSVIEGVALEHRSEQVVGQHFLRAEVGNYRGFSPGHSPVLSFDQNLYQAISHWQAEATNDNLFPWSVGLSIDDSDGRAGWPRDCLDTVILNVNHWIPVWVFLCQRFHTGCVGMEISPELFFEQSLGLSKGVSETMV
jgi:hypothetical protein